MAKGRRVGYSLPEAMSESLIEQIYRKEWSRILAILIRLVGSFELAEDAVQAAFSAAVEQWPRQGMPGNPRAWLISTARHKAIDALRRQSHLLDSAESETVLEALQQTFSCGIEDPSMLDDDRLRLIFTCCHPALSREAQVALTLRTLCGLTTEQIADAFLVPLVTMRQRLVRAKQKIHDAGIPYRTPSRADLDERLASVLLVVYLVFNEGYSDPGRRIGLCEEAIRLGHLLEELLPQQAEVRGILALMVLHHSRRAARLGDNGDFILLEDQDRSLWHRGEMRQGLELAASAMRDGPGPYSIQAAIVSIHVRARHASETDWAQIVTLYDALLRLNPSPVIELNRAVAVAMAKGCQAGLGLLDDLDSRAELSNYALLPAARGALLLRLRQWEPAAKAYRKALALASPDPADPERRFLAQRLAEAETNHGGATGDAPD